jgi:hypothetical protein
MGYLDSFILLLVINGVGYIGRMAPNLFADKHMGPLTLMVPFVMVTGVCLLAWIAVTPAGGLYV